MNPIKVMINGLPGNVATMLIRHARLGDRFEVLPFSLTGQEIDDDRVEVDGFGVALIRPDVREDRMAAIIAAESPFISIDFTHPSAVNGNAAFYCAKGLPFVMGTTGGDRDQLDGTVRNGSVPAVIAPNMARQIVGFQAMMEYAAETFPGLFKGYNASVRESHQAGKADTSGTAKAVVGSLQRLGIDFAADRIEMERDPVAQQKEWGIPEEHLTGHGWHTYTLESPDKTALFAFTHNINGRDIYAQGTLEAVEFLAAKIEAGIGGEVFSMIDVLKGV